MPFFVSLQILTDASNYGFEGIAPALVTHVNGTKVINLRHLRALVLANTAPHLRFDFADDGPAIVLDREAAAAATAAITARHNIAAPCSRDLLDH